MRTRAVACLLAAALALPLIPACVEGSGMNGPQLAPPRSGEGPCFEANLTDGLQGGDEALLVFQCFNQHGAFEELAPSVEYLCTAETADSFVTAFNELEREVDLSGNLELGANLLSDPDEPLKGALSLYQEAYELRDAQRSLFGAAITLAWEGADELLACEESADPDSCSVIRLSRRVLATELVDQAQRVMDAVAATSTEEEKDDNTRTMIEVLNESTTAAGNDKNAILDLALFMMDDGGKVGQAPIERLLPYLQYLVSRDLDGDGDADRNPKNDDLVGKLVTEYARLWREGTLQKLPDMMTTLYTTNSKGTSVGWDGEGIIDELLAISEELGGDPALLTEEIVLPTGTKTTALELALDTLDDIYENNKDVSEIVTTLSDTTEDLCDGASNDLCGIAEDALPPLTAAVKTGIADIVIPAVYVMHQMVDFDVLFELADLALELDLLARTEMFSQISLERGLLERNLNLFPVFVNATDGEFTPEGEDAFALATFAINPWSEDGGAEVVPLLVPRPLIVRTLRPERPVADLDWLLGALLPRVLDPSSALSLEQLDALMLNFDEAQPADAEPVDLLAEARTILDNEALWMAGLRLGADWTLMELVSPTAEDGGPLGYLYDLVNRGVLDRVLGLAADVMDMLNDDDADEGDTGSP
jgi:hypothetical protein